MKKIVIALGIAAALAVGTFVLAQAPPPAQPKTPPDPRIDKLLEQNEQILKNQTEILKQLDEIKAGLTQVRRRTS
jgi:hypothetical protein